MREDRVDIDGRTVGFADFGSPAETAVIHCHGGPGSRLEPAWLEAAARDAGFRMIGIDRPGYGFSTPFPERTIADWVPDALAVADALGIERFATVGVSTGGGYALALPALAPERVLGAVFCCGLSDIRLPELRALEESELRDDMHALWAPDAREDAIAVATEMLGEDGSKTLEPGGPALAPSDMALLSSPDFMATFLAARPAMFAQGVIGYVDDRRAERPGWQFDVGAVRCPVTVLQGSEDSWLPLYHAEHTAKIVPGATLQVVEGHGHLSIVGEIVPTLTALLARAAP